MVGEETEKKGTRRLGEHGLDFVKLEFQLAQVQLKTAKERKQLNRSIIERKGKDDYVS